MKKKDIRILTIILAMPLIVGLVVAGVFQFGLEKSEWITLITSCISTFAAIFLGYMVFFQNENHKKRQEEKDALYKEEERKNRQQDLMLRANPHAVFNKIDCIRYAPGSMSLSKDHNYNRLTNIDFEEYHSFEEHVYMDLHFTVPANNVVERIYINSVILTCYHGDFRDDDFKEIAKFLLKNHSPNTDSTNIKINQTGGVDSLLTLLFDMESDEDDNVTNLKKLMDNLDYNWTLVVYYTLSNSFNVEIDYNTHIKFTLLKGKENEYGDIVYKLAKSESTTITTSNIHIKEKTNELNA